MKTPESQVHTLIVRQQDDALLDQAVQDKLAADPDLENNDNKEVVVKPRDSLFGVVPIDQIPESRELNNQVHHTMRRWLEQDEVDEYLRDHGILVDPLRSTSVESLPSEM